LPQFTKSKTFRIAAVLALLIGLYALAGFWLAPRLLRGAILEQIPKQLVGVKPSVGEIRVNPFLLQVEVRDFSLTGARGTTLAGFGRFFIKFELSSIWHRAYTFSRIDIAAPFVNAIIAQDGRLNLLQLSPKPAPPKPDEKSNGPLPAIRIGAFTVSRGLLTYEDRSHPSDFAARLEPINFELLNFTTGVDGGRFTFTGTSKLGERLEWHGHVTAQPIASDGEFRIDGLQAHTIWEYLKDRLNFNIDSGKIDLSATYQFALKEDLDLKLDLSQVALTGLRVKPKDSDLDWISLPELIVSDTHVDLLKRQAHSDAVSLTGLKLVTWLEPDGSFNLLKLAATPGAAPAATVAATATPAVSAAAAAGPAWQFTLREFALQDASISAEDRSVRPATKLLLAPLSVKLEGASLDLSKAVSLNLDTKVNDKGSLHVTGEITPQPIDAKLAIKLSNIDLAAVQPYIAQQTSLTLLSGGLSGDIKVHYGPKKPTLQLGGDLSFADLHTVDNALRDDFINWERLDIQGLNFQRDPDRLDIEQILARKLYARVIIEPDESINVKRVLAGPGATVVAPIGPKGAPEAATAPPAPPKPQPRSKGASRNRDAPARVVAAAPAAPLMPMRIRKIVLRAGQANFTDLSVTPNFSTGIQNLEGTILGLSSQDNSRAKIDLHGSVEAFAPVSITGEVNVLGPTLYTDLAMSFRNIELSTFNPYSGKFAGYNIAKGKLTTELHYKVDGRKLDAQHHIVVDQLEFGAKTDSKQAVSLPIKLAVALLKDRDGVIDLNLPVSGTLDDPKFKLSSVIWQVLVHLLEKAVTAPFALLGSLFGGGPNLQFVDFQPGSADLDPAGTEKTQAMVKALDARPQLKIEVPIATLDELDRPRLLETKFQAQIREVQMTAGARKKSAAVPSAFEQLDPAAQLDILTQVYVKNMGSEPKYPPAVGDIKGKPEAGVAKLQYLSGALHEHLTVSAADLTALGQQRAMNLQQALLTGTNIDPARVFLVASDKAKNEGGLVRLEFSLR
jgi:Domain of Unknown Function (DUF748)